MLTTEVNSVRPRIVRITVTDAYATDSSSDEEEVGVSRRRRVKKFTIGPCVAERGNDVKQAAIGVRIASPLEDAAKELNVVDEEGIPQSNTDTLPTDQALAVIVDTNSIVRNEIPLPQFSPTVRQKNSDEALGNDEVEEGEIWPKRTEEGGIAEVQCDSSFVAKRKRKEKSPRGERRSKKTTGVGIGAPLEDILLTKGMGPKDLAKHMEGVKPTKFERRTRLRQRELKVNDTPSSKKQSKSVEGGTSRNTSGEGLAESNVDVNTAGGQKSSKSRSTSVIGKGEIKIKKPHSTEPTYENEGVLDTAFRSSLRGIIMLIKELNLRTCHKEVLKRTPFWGIFEAIIENKLSPKQCRKSDKMIIKIINTYDPAAKIFRLGKESMELTRADMVSIFGISCGNKFVDLKYGPKEKVKLVKRREISETRLTSKSVKQLLQKYLGSEEEEDVEDVARLLCLYLFHTFLFPTGPTVKWVYLERIEDLDRLRDYDWNEAIINELMSSIRKHHREPRKVTGCVMALLYWLCERTNLSKPLHPEHPLGIVKWDIPLVVSGFKKIRLKDLKPGQVVSRQANVARTADGEVPVDKDIVQDSVLSGDVPVSNRGNDACSVRGESDEKTPGGERGNNRTTRARIDIALEDMLQVEEMCLKDASRELQGSQSTLKYAFQELGIHIWPLPTPRNPMLVDQVEIPLLNFGTLPSDQALEATVDRNSVLVKEIPPPLVLPTALQENLDEDLDNYEVEATGIAGEGKEEDEIVEAQLHTGCFGKRKRKEKIPGGERGNKKTTRVRNVIPLEEILQVKEMLLKDAAKHLKVSQSKLKSSCREYGIHRWPPRYEHKLVRQSLPKEIPAFFNQDGILELISNSLPSDQPLMATVDTNSVVKEIPPPWISPTAQQENRNENFATDEVEVIGMGSVGTWEGEMEVGQLNSGCSGKGKRIEKTSRGERGNKKTTGVRITIPLEDILQTKEMRFEDAAKHLNVSQSTLKQACLEYNIYGWPPRGELKLLSQYSPPNKSPTVVGQGQIPQLNYDTLLLSNQVPTAVNTNSTVTVKARCGKETIKFRLSWPGGMVELKQQVKKRLELEDGTYSIRYKDEDGDLILLACDEDLRDFISSSSPLGSKSIEILLELK